MSTRRHRGDQRARAQAEARPARPGDLWRPVPELTPPEPIEPAADPTALLRSLGEPPLQGQSGAAEHYLAAVVERAAALGTALAATAGLLATPEDD